MGVVDFLSYKDTREDGSKLNLVGGAGVYEQLLALNYRLELNSLKIDSHKFESHYTDNLVGKQ